MISKKLIKELEKRKYYEKKHPPKTTEELIREMSRDIQKHVDQEIMNILTSCTNDTTKRNN